MTEQISARAEAFLGARAIDLEVAVRLGLASGTFPGTSSEALVIPFVRDGQVVRRKYRTIGSEKRFSQDKGGVRCVFNEDCLRDDSLKDQPVVITEGELDCVAAIQAGMPRSISVPDGAPPPGERDEDEVKESAKYAWFEPIKRLLTAERVPFFILATDGDENGAALLHDLSHLLGRERCKFIVYPKARAVEKGGRPRGRERLKDLNEVLEDYGAKGVLDCLGRAQFLKVDGIYAMDELPPDPPRRVFDIGFDAFREHYVMRTGDLSVVTGIPSMGKSTWVNDLVCRVVRVHGIRAGWASFEQSPQVDHKRALRSWFCNAPMHTITPVDLAAADEWINEAHRFIVPNEDDDVTLDWMLRKMAAAVIQHDCRIIIIDPWNEMDHTRDRDETTTEYVGRAIKALKRFARKMNVHLIVVAHPTKQKRENGEFLIPTLYDISDSAHWYNKADLGVVVHRRNDGKSVIKTQKSRYHEILGRPGAVLMDYNRDTRHFVEIERLP